MNIRNDNGVNSRHAIHDQKPVAMATHAASGQKQQHQQPPPLRRAWSTEQGSLRLSLRHKRPSQQQRLCGTGTINVSGIESLKTQPRPREQCSSNRRQELPQRQKTPAESDNGLSASGQNTTLVAARESTATAADSDEAVISVDKPKRPQKPLQGHIKLWSERLRTKGTVAEKPTAERNECTVTSTTSRQDSAQSGTDNVTVKKSSESYLTVFQRLHRRSNTAEQSASRGHENRKRLESSTEPPAFNSRKITAVTSSKSPFKTAKDPKQTTFSKKKNPAGARGSDLSVSNVDKKDGRAHSVISPKAGVSCHTDMNKASGCKSRKEAANNPAPKRSTGAKSPGAINTTGTTVSQQSLLANKSQKSQGVDCHNGISRTKEPTKSGQKQEQIVAKKSNSHNSTDHKRCRHRDVSDNDRIIENNNQNAVETHAKTAPSAAGVTGDLDVSDGVSKDLNNFEQNNPVASIVNLLQSKDEKPDVPFEKMDGKLNGFDELKCTKTEIKPNLDTSDVASPSCDPQCFMPIYVSSTVTVIQNSFNERRIVSAPAESEAALSGSSNNVVTNDIEDDTKKNEMKVDKSPRSNGGPDLEAITTESCETNLDQVDEELLGKGLAKVTQEVTEDLSAQEKEANPDNVPETNAFALPTICVEESVDDNTATAIDLEPDLITKNIKAKLESNNNSMFPKDLHASHRNYPLLDVILEDDSNDDTERRDYSRLHPSSAAKDGNDLEKVKAVTHRLRLETRRESTVAWQEKYLSPSKRPTLRRTWALQDERIEPEWSNDKEVEISSALVWLRDELVEMQSQDMDLSRRLICLREEMQQLRLQKLTAAHQATIKDAVDMVEDKDEASELCDELPEMLNAELRQCGITQLNLSRRRFSVF